jgi:hypothetical protein
MDVGDFISRITLLAKLLKSIGIPSEPDAQVLGTS